MNQILYFGMGQRDITKIKILQWFFSIAKKIAENTKSKSLISIVGGGDTLLQLKIQGLKRLLRIYQQLVVHS